ncbi:MAG: PRC-barrel domain-containing protein [Stellaceae bacterium]
MIKQPLAALLIATLAAGAAGEAIAAESSVAPQMNTGLTNQPPKTSAVSPAADQISATNVVGANVENASGAVIAKITDLVIDRRSNAAAVAIIAPAGGNLFGHRKSAIAWSSLRYDPRPNPHFATALDRQALAAGTSLVEQAKTGTGYYDLKTDLLGKPVVGPDGQPVGHVQNLVLTFGSGRVVALVVDTGGFISMGAKDHAVAWDAARPQAGRNGATVRIALSKTQVDAAPVTATIAPAPIPPKAGNNKVEVRRDSTGNISGTLIPAPADRR